MRGEASSTTIVGRRESAPEPVGGGQPGDAATDDDDDAVCCWLRARRQRGTARPHCAGSSGTDRASSASQHHDEEAGPAGHPPAVLAGVLVLVLAIGGGAGLARSTSAEAASGGRIPSADAAARKPAADDAGGAPSRGARQVADVDPLDARRHLDRPGHPAHRKISRARAEVIRLVTSWNGTVADEQITSDDRGRMTDTTHDAAGADREVLRGDDRLRRAGPGRAESRNSEDVTTQVVDNDARVRAAERSIRQIERLLSRAEDLGDMIAIESDLARRQADLDSLKSQQAWLADQTSLSTINVYLSRPGSVQPHEDDDAGSSPGSRTAGRRSRARPWWCSTAVGAVLPFAVLLPRCSALPLWLVVRRRAVAAQRAECSCTKS